MDKKTRCHLKFTYEDVAKAIGISHKHMLNELSRNKVRLKDMSFIQLVDFILTNIDLNKTHLSYFRKNKPT